jgi:hypothetical protein
MGDVRIALESPDQPEVLRLSDELDAYRVLRCPPRAR